MKLYTKLFLDKFCDIEGFFSSITLHLLIAIHHDIMKSSNPYFFHVSRILVWLIAYEAMSRKTFLTYVIVPYMYWIINLKRVIKLQSVYIF